MATECRQDSFDFGTVEGRAVVGAFDGGVISSDAGALLLGATDKAIALVDRFAGCFRDGPRQELIEHSIKTLVRQRVIGIVLGVAAAWSLEPVVRSTVFGCKRRAPRPWRLS